jgi:hypothetical protein
MKTLTSTIILSLLFAGGLAKAHHNNNRKARQEHRITNGAENGSLTKREERRLNHGQHRIDRAQKKAEADGVVTDREKAKLERMQNRQSRKIFREKHDGQNQQAKPAEPATPAAPAEGAGE